MPMFIKAFIYVMYEPSGKVTKNQEKFREKSGKNQGIYTSLLSGHPVLQSLALIRKVEGPMAPTNLENHK